MGNYNVGSFIDDVHVEIPDVPERISGTNMTNTITRQIYKVNNWCGSSLSTTGIEDKYQPAIFNFTCAAILASMELEGSDTNELRIGEFMTKKGQGSNLGEARKKYDEAAKQALMALGKKVNFYQAL